LISSPLVAAIYGYGDSNFSPRDDDAKVRASTRFFRRRVWTASWCAVLLLQYGMFTEGMIKWRSSANLWPRASVCRGTFGASQSQDSKGWLALYACPDVIALYNLARHLQSVNTSIFLMFPLSFFILHF